MVRTGDVLKETRERAGLTQDQVAIRLGKSRSAWANYEANRRVPSVLLIKKYLSLDEIKKLKPKKILDDFFQDSEGES